MKWPLTVLSVLAGALCVSPATAQTNRLFRTELAAQEGEKLPAHSPAAQERQMYEDIEILRRLLNRGLRATQPQAHSTSVLNTAFSPDGKSLVTGNEAWTVLSWDVDTGKQMVQLVDVHHASGELHGPQGTYLKGYGIVYTMTVPVHFQRPAVQSGQPAPKPPSEWERMRRELRGQKVKSGDGATRANPSGVEVLLKVLAENGHNLSQLSENERVTLVLTLPRSQDCSKCHAEPINGDSVRGTSRLGLNNNRGAVGTIHADFDGDGLVDAVFVGNVPKEVEEEVKTRKTEARKQALLGDLHAKNGQQRDAAEAYQKAVDSYQKLLEWKRRVDLDVTGLPGKDVQADLEAVEIHTKLAQAYLALGERDKAVKVMQNMAGYAQRAGQGIEKKPADKLIAVPLPSKLILSAPKKLLDQVGSGKLSFEDFRKEVTLEYLDFAEKAKP